MKRVVCTSVGIKNSFEETLGVGNVVVPSGFMGNQCMEGKVGCLVILCFFFFNSPLYFIGAEHNDLFIFFRVKSVCVFSSELLGCFKGTSISVMWRD